MVIQDFGRIGLSDAISKNAENAVPVSQELRVFGIDKLGIVY